MPKQPEPTPFGVVAKNIDGYASANDRLELRRHLSHSHKVSEGFFRLYPESTAIINSLNHWRMQPE